MADYKIQFGEIDDFVFIGVQPPAHREISDVLEGFGRSGERGAHILPIIVTRVPEAGEPYAEIGLRGGEFLIDHMLVNGLASLLESRQHTVEVDRVRHALGRGHYLFVEQTTIAG